MAELSVADSSAGPLTNCMRAAFLPTGRCWEAVWTEKIRMLTETAIANRTSLLMYTAHMGVFTLLKHAPSSWTPDAMSPPALSVCVRRSAFLQTGRAGGEKLPTVKDNSQ